MCQKVVIPARCAPPELGSRLFNRSCKPYLNLDSRLRCPGMTRKGFTLIELLVVVLIIGILAAVAVPQYQKAVVKSRYMQLMTAGDAIHRAEEAYYMANGVYTNDLSALDIEYPASGDFSLAPDVRADGHAAINAVSSKWHMGHIVYFDNHSGAGRGRRECRVCNNDSVLHQVCRGLTNSASGNSVSGYTYYIFQ